MQKKCAICDILLDVACANPACAGHHNESMGDVCVFGVILVLILLALCTTIAYLMGLQDGLQAF